MWYDGSIDVSVTGGRRGADASVSVGGYRPTTNKIVVNMNIIQESYVCWRRVAIAVYAHEFIHMIDWFFFAKRDMKKWKAASDERAEYWAYRIEGIVLKLLLTGVSVRISRDVAGKEES